MKTASQDLYNVSSILRIEKNEAKKIIEKAIAGGEIHENFPTDKWIHKRLAPNIVFIDEDQYAEMCVDALKILRSTAATDYGSSRQRDMGQLWADMTRGYLGEIAFVKFLKEKYQIESRLGHEVGDLQQYLPSDIHKIRLPNDRVFRDAKCKVGIKTSKWNGIWLDLPGDQFNHSEYHVFVKVGAGRNHLFSFFKNISVFRDKVLKKGIEVGSLTKQQADELFDNLPSFTPIPAYICGFVPWKTDYDILSYSGKKGRLHFTIKSWNGPIRLGDLEIIKSRENIDGNVKFEGIGKFSHDSGYLFNTGNLLWRKKDWDVLVNNL